MTRTLVRTDASVKDAVEDELRWTPGVDGAHIGVVVDHGAVTLSGTVRSYPEKLLAGRAVQGVRGVVGIAQELTVASPWTERGDADIAREAGEAVQRSVDVPDSVKVAVHERFITLSGAVRWQFQRTAAHQAVSSLRGIHGVLNEVSIASADDASGTTTAIGLAVLRNAALEGATVGVSTTEGGAVTLTGTVRSWTEKHQAQQIAWSGPGVTAVTNLLRIVE